MKSPVDNHLRSEREVSEYSDNFISECRGADGSADHNVHTLLVV